jgi:ubiquinone/menaquinone biosynthesis C-methylase UbiE
VKYYNRVWQMNEVERIRFAYSKRHADAVVYSVFNPGHLFMAQQLERELIKSFRGHGMAPLGNKRILDIGCGTASPLRKLIDFGAEPENLSGIDLLPNAIDEAKRISPHIDFRCGNAEALPFGSESFDIVTQFTTFTSILDEEMKRRVAKEMLRVLTPNGIILWYDYFVSKPTNPDVKGIGKGEIIRLFPNLTFHFNKVTLAPPIARTVAPYSFLLCYLFEKVPWLRTHYLVVIRKTGVQDA